MMLLSDRWAKAESILLRLHDAIREGQDERVESLNDELTSVSYEISEPLLDILNGLSADLYSLGGEESRFPASVLGIGDEGPDLTLKRALAEDDYRRVLLILRSEDLRLPEDRRSYLRATIYRRFGFFAASSRFFGLARSLAPTNPSYPYLHLSSLIEQLSEEALSVARSITGEGSQAWASLALGYWVQISISLAKNDEVDQALVAEAVERVGRLTTTERILKEEPAVASTTLVQLGLWHELLGQHDLARDRFLNASLVDPDNEEAHRLLHEPFEIAIPSTGTGPTTQVRAEQAAQRKVSREFALALAA